MRFGNTFRQRVRGYMVVERKYMITNNLKVGDRFTDGNRLFEVLNVVSDGVYISKYVGDTKETDIKPIKEEKKDKSYTKTEINRMPYDDLKELCVKMELEVASGTAMKKAIIEKLGL